MARKSDRTKGDEVTEFRLYTLHSQKGGVGKTSLAIAIAGLERAFRGARTLLVDADLTGTCIGDALRKDPAELRPKRWLNDLLLADPDVFTELTVKPGRRESRSRDKEAAWRNYLLPVSKDRNHTKKTNEGQEIVPGGFDAMPEVREMLEWQIARGNRSVEALSVIGSRVNLICWIDKKWLAAHAGQLFHLEGLTETPPVADGWAAWNAFLVWVPPHVEFYRLFKQQFAYAIAQSAQVELTDQTRDEQPMNHLGEHLMILYGRGQLGLDDDGGLLRRFLTDANPDIRRHAVSFVGSSVEGDEKIPDRIVSRFQELWNVYWAGAGRKDAEQKHDAGLFGTWFASGQFPEQWALEQLEAFVEVTPTPEPGHAVAEQLAKIAHADIARAVRILDRIVRADREGWRTYRWREPARQILEAAMQAGGDARTHAEQVINYLGRRGYTEFGTLLNLKSMTDPL